MGGWFAAHERCRVCGHECLGVFPEEADPDALECVHCGNMTSEAVAYIEADGALRSVDEDEVGPGW